MKLTDAKIKSLKPQKKRYIEWEDGHTGMGVRVSPVGRKSFIFMYRFEGRPRMMTIGPYPRVSLATARLNVAEAKAMLDKNLDPGAALVGKRRKERESDTFAELAEEYLEKWARPRKRSAAEDERILRRDVIPLWGRRKAKDIRRRDVIELLDGIVLRGSPIAANRSLAVIRKLYNWAMSRDIVDATPCAAIPAPSKENRRDRVLSETEIKTFWNGLDKASLSEGSRLALKLQLVTAQRKGEIVSAEWPEIDMGVKVWTIPAEKSKNGLPHRVPLSDLALELLEKVEAWSSGSKWLFPSEKNTGHVIETSVDHALRRNLDILGLERFTPHDLRRTAASFMAAMGVSRVVISKVLNHAESGVTAVYDRHGYDDEKRQALDAWGRKLVEMCEREPQNKVVALCKSKTAKTARNL